MNSKILLSNVSALFAALLLMAAPAFSQTQPSKVTGRVTDENGDPMAGVTVIVEGAPNVGTTTGTSGEYTLNSPPHAER